MNPILANGFQRSNLKLKLTRNFVLCLLGSFLTIAQPALPATSANTPQAQSHPDIHKLVKNMAWNELQASEHPSHYYRYINREISPDGSRTAEEIQTSQGIASHLLTVNGKSPSLAQRQKNKQLLSKLTTDARFRQSRLKDEQQNIKRRDSIIKNMPQAFIYTYLGKSELGYVHLKFRPNPRFNPSSRQALVLEGMAGELWIDPSSQRMVKVDGTLIKDVTIGWGFLARLYKGGRFLMEQSKGQDGAWHQKLLSVDFDGTELIFKSIHVHERLIRCCFERVPHDLSIKEAVQMMREHSELPAHWKSNLDAIEKANDIH